MSESSIWQPVADALAARIEARFLTQKELAALSGVGEDTISKIVNVRQEGYRPSTLKALARALGWPAEAFFLIIDGVPPSELPDVTPEGPGFPPAGAAGYDARISQLDPEDVAFVEAAIEAAERRKGIR